MVHYISPLKVDYDDTNLPLYKVFTINKNSQGHTSLSSCIMNQKRMLVNHLRSYQFI
jgi:hypothetical protein